LWPEFAWGHFNLGYVLYRGGEREQAIEHYSAALQCDGSFAKAVFNRGLAYKELGRFREALADFDRTAALATMTDPMLAERALVLEKLGRHDEADQCFTGIFERVDSLEAASRNGIRLAYGFAVAERRGEKAHDAFEAVLRDKGATPQALAQAHYGEGMLLAPTRPRQAIQALSQAIETDTNLSEARRFRGILWARVGDFEAAGRDINWCLEHDSDSGSKMYAAACITALAAKKLSGNRKTELASSAIEMLKKAFAQGYGKDIAAKDPDLTALRGQPEFERLLRPAK
jgi:tetratricopeptide (TPR) repeat protein